MAGGVARAVLLARQFALAVDGRGLALHKGFAACSAIRRQRQHFTVGPLGLFGLRLCLAVKGLMGDDDPRHAPRFGRCWWLQGQSLARHGQGARPFAQRVELLRRVGQHGAGARVIAKGGGKTQGALGGLALQRHAVGGGLFQCGIGQQGAVAGIGRARRAGRAVCDGFVLHGGIGVALVFEQKLGQQEALLRRCRPGGHGGQQPAVPLHGLIHIGRCTALLRQCVVVLCQLGQMRQNQRLRRLPTGGVGAAEFAVGAVALHMVLLGGQGQGGEAVVGVDLHHARLQQWRLGVQRLAPHEGGQGVGRVLDALLLAVQIGQLQVDAVLVAFAQWAVDQRGHALGTLQAGQAQAQHAEAVFHQFAVGAA